MFFKIQHCSCFLLRICCFFCLVDPTRIYNKKVGYKKAYQHISVCILILFVDIFSENEQQNHFHFLVVVVLSHLLCVVCCVCVCRCVCWWWLVEALVNHYVFYCWRHYVTGFCKWNFRIILRLSSYSFNSVLFLWFYLIKNVCNHWDFLFRLWNFCYVLEWLKMAALD